MAGGPLPDPTALLARLGPVGAGVVAAAGLLFFVLGHRGFRPAAALLAAAGGALAWTLLPAAGALPAGFPPRLALASAAVLAFAAGVVLPRAGGVLLGAAAGLAAGAWAVTLADLESERLLLMAAGTVVGALLLAATSPVMPQLLPPLAGGLLVAAALFAMTGARGAGPELLAAPVFWLAVALVLWTAGYGLEQARLARRETRAAEAAARARDEEKKRREEEAARRWDRYMQ